MENQDPFLISKAINSYRLNFERTNWPLFTRRLSCLYQTDINLVRENTSEFVTSSKNLTNDEVDLYFKKIESLILKAIDATIMKKQEPTSSAKYSNATIRLIKRNKNDAIKALHNAKRHHNLYTVDEINVIKNRLKLLKTLLKENFKISINKYWEKTLKSISHSDPKNMYPTINKIFRNTKLNSNITTLQVPLSEKNTLENNISITEFEEIENQNAIIIHGEIDTINTLGYYFEKTHKNIEDLGTLTNNNQVRNAIDNFNFTSEATPLTTFNFYHRAFQPVTHINSFTNLDQTRQILKHTNNKKSSGLDLIPNIVLKHLPNNITRDYCTIFNNLINNSYYPKAWKTAKIIPILKKGKNPSRPESYRPVSLVLNISKAFEKVILQQIISYSDEKALIPEQQYGFRKNHSTIHALSRLVSDICWQKNNGRGVGALLIDTEKAFDTVWLNGLLFKLIKYNFPTNLVSILKVMLHGKTFKVADFKNNFSQLFEIENGLQQGTVLAPILFALYTSELLNNCIFQAPGNGVIAYADDLIIYSSGTIVSQISRQVQIMIDEVSQYCKVWKQKINPGKCELILFREPLRSGPPNFTRNWKKFKVKIDQSIITTTTSVKYLGVHLDEKFNYNKHAKKVLAKGKNTVFALNKLFYSKFIDCRVKTICYQTLVRPVLTYGCQVWFHIEPSIMEDIRRLERRVLRLCLGTKLTIESGFTKYIANRKLYTKIDIPRIDNFIIKITRDHIARSSIVDNANIAGPLLTVDNRYIKRCLTSGIIPPEAFIYLDSRGYVQNNEGIPILYHIPRDYPKKQITFDPQNTNFIYNTAVPDVDIPNTTKMKKRYWWH